MNEPFRILIVDDDPDDVELTRQMLNNERLCSEVSSAGNGREALVFLRRQDPGARSRRPDLILLDLNMPVMNGREFLSALKADPALCAIPVVIFTTSRAAEEIVGCYGLGANGFVNKPMDLEQFSELERVVVDFRDEALRRRAGR